MRNERKKDIQIHHCMQFYMHDSMRYEEENVYNDEQTFPKAKKKRENPTKDASHPVNSASKTPWTLYNYRA